MRDSYTERGVGEGIDDGQKGGLAEEMNVVVVADVFLVLRSMSTVEEESKEKKGGVFLCGESQPLDSMDHKINGFRWFSVGHNR
jgi:hypothetical protein